MCGGGAVVVGGGVRAVIRSGGGERGERLRQMTSEQAGRTRFGFCLTTTTCI